MKKSFIFDQKILSLLLIEKKILNES